MALVKCPECGNNVSDKSATCIHCGYPLNPDVKGTNGEKAKLRSKSRTKIILIVVAVAVLIIGAITLVNKLNEKKEEQAYQAQLEAEQKAYQAMIYASRENITPYLEYIGQHYKAGEKISLPSELYDNIENVEFMGMRGEIEFGTTATSQKDDYYVRYCSWTSFDAFLEEEFQALADDLNNYFGYEADVDSKLYSSGPTYRYYWIDPNTDLYVTYGHGLFSYHTDGNIEVMWATEFCEGADFFGL